MLSKKCVSRNICLVGWLIVGYFSMSRLRQHGTTKCSLLRQQFVLAAGDGSQLQAMVVGTTSSLAPQLSLPNCNSCGDFLSFQYTFPS